MYTINIIILIILLLLLFVNIISSICCERKSVFGCWGKGSCNIFCCNCNNGCESKEHQINYFIKNFNFEIIPLKKKCETKCIKDRTRIYGSYIYDKLTNKCSYTLFCINTNFPTYKSCINSCVY